MGDAICVSPSPHLSLEKGKQGGGQRVGEGMGGVPSSTNHILLSPSSGHPETAMSRSKINKETLPPAAQDDE